MKVRFRRIRMLCALIVATLLAASITVLGPVEVARADPGCQDGGYYVLWARGSGQPLEDGEARAFRNHTFWALNELGITKHSWGELGNVDGSLGSPAGRNPDDPANEYPATPVNDYHVLPPLYGSSVRTGTDELVNHLNDRYAGNGPRDNGPCQNETVIIGGYSQGADVVGWALERNGGGGFVSLLPQAKNHIGYVALYGDPKLDAFACPLAPWVKGNTRCSSFGIISMLYGSRDPYVRSEFQGRFGSWCDINDGICTRAAPIEGSHGSTYEDYWIWQSAHEVVGRSVAKYRLFNPGLPQVMIPQEWSLPPFAQEVSQAPSPTITHVKRTKDDSGANQVYAATRYAVTEAWWRPGGDGVHTKEIIHISQGNIVGFDKTNLPEGKQAVFTAVPDGIWESGWDANNQPGGAKIISGLNGVRQVIADNRWENGQYYHRLYILAQDGPYEAWWRDGDPEGIHLRRLVQIDGGIAMTKSTGPSGEDQLYVATPTWAYEVWWNGGGIHWDTIVNITQGDIDTLSKVLLPGGQQRLFTGTSTGVWQSIWQNSTPEHNPEVTGKSGLVHSEAMLTGDAFQEYIATPGEIREFWRTPNNTGNDALTSRYQNDITVFDKFNDGGFQQVYFGTTNGGVYEVYWGGGAGPKTELLYEVQR